MSMHQEVSSPAPSALVTTAAISEVATLGPGSPFADISEPLARRLLLLSELVHERSGCALVTQYHQATHFYFLLRGQVKFQITLESEGHSIDVGSSREPWTPIGWSAFRPPHRYATTVSTSTQAEFLRFRVDELEEFFETEPALGWHFYRAVTRAAGHLLLDGRERLVSHLRPSTSIAHWDSAFDRARAITRRDRPRTLMHPSSARNTTATAARGTPRIASEESMVTNAAPPVEEVLRKSSFFEHLPEAFLQKIREISRVCYFCRGDVLQQQGERAVDVPILADGRLRLEYSGSSFRTAVLRIMNDAGTVLSSSAASGSDVYDTTARATRDGTLIRIPREQLEHVLRENPRWACLFQKRVLWLISRQLRVARAHLVSETFDREVLAIESVLEQVRTELSVSSPLHKLPHLLKSTVTLPDALAVVDAARTSSDHLAAHTADICHELLAPVRRENRFFAGLQAAFEEVVGAQSQTDAAQLRRRSAESFVRVFSQIPTEVRGMNLLPPHSGNIFIFNHLKNHEHNTLPNGFQLTLDSHFISSMILHKHYGDPGVRVVRRSRASEYGHQAYYQRLGHIPVYTPESDLPEETRSERFRSFIEAASFQLSQGQNLVLAPEGTSYSTEESPGSFKAGAFRLAAAITPEPLIVPVAMANFDRRLAHTKLVAVIHPPFRITEFVNDLDDPRQMDRFLSDYRAQFSDYVREAAALSVA